MKKRKINVKKTPVITLAFEDGKERHFKFNNAALLVLEEEFGNSLEILSQAKEKPFSCIGKIVYAGLKWEDENLTLAEVNEMIPFDMDFISEIMDCTLDTMPQGDGKN
jgi:hypothetical protein